MDINEMRERAAELARRAKELIAPYSEGEIPKDVAAEIKRVIAEAKELNNKIAKHAGADELRRRVDEDYDLHWQGQGARTPDPKVVTLGNDWGEGDAGFGAFVRAALTASLGGRRDPRLVLASKVPGFAKDLEEGTGSAGGFLVPTEYEARLLQVAAETSIVRPRAYIQPMSRRQLDIPALDYAVFEDEEKKSNFYGGVYMEWTEEAGTKPKVEPKFRLLQLVAWELTGYLPTSETLLEDTAIALPPLMARLFGGATGWTQDFAFLSGDGVAKPLGVIAAPATIVVARQGAGAFSYVDAVNMWAQLLPGTTPVWVMATSVKPQLPQFVDPNGNYIWHPAGGVSGAGSPMPGGLLGYPIIWTEKLPALGTNGDVLLADFNYYVIGERKGLTIAYSEHYLFRTNQWAWKCVSRVDGKPWLNAPIQGRDGTNVSPFIILGAYSE